MERTEESKDKQLFVCNESKKDKNFMISKNFECEKFVQFKDNESIHPALKTRESLKEGCHLSVPTSENKIKLLKHVSNKINSDNKLNKSNLLSAQEESNTGRQTDELLHANHLSCDPPHLKIESAKNMPQNSNEKFIFENRYLNKITLPKDKKAIMRKIFFHHVGSGSLDKDKMMLKVIRTRSLSCRPADPSDDLESLNKGNISTGILNDGRMKGSDGDRVNKDKTATSRILNGEIRVV